MITINCVSDIEMNSIQGGMNLIQFAPTPVHEIQWGVNDIQFAVNLMHGGVNPVHAKRQEDAIEISPERISRGSQGHCVWRIQSVERRAHRLYGTRARGMECGKAPV
jgi:hypothetical protein